MRLIDADKLIEDRVENDPVVIAAKYAPTAYDFDKVIERLADKIDPNEDVDTGERLENWVVDMQNHLIGECIDVVRSGIIKADNEGI